MKQKEKNARRSLRLNKIVIVFSASASISQMISSIIQWRSYAASLTLICSICFLIITLIYLKARSNLVSELNNVMVKSIMES